MNSASSPSDRLTAFVHACLAALLAVFLAGCGDKEVDPNKPFALSGADKVLTALKAKDYENVVANLVEVRGKMTEKDMEEYRRLRTKVTDQLITEMGDSDPAKEAYRAIGMMETGR